MTTLDTLASALSSVKNTDELLRNFNLRLILQHYQVSIKSQNNINSIEILRISDNTIVVECIINIDYSSSVEFNQALEQEITRLIDRIHSQSDEFRELLKIKYIFDYSLRKSFINPPFEIYNSKGPVLSIYHDIDDIENSIYLCIRCDDESNNQIYLKIDTETLNKFFDNESIIGELLQNNIEAFFFLEIGDSGDVLRLPIDLLNTFKVSCSDKRFNELIGAKRPQKARILHPEEDPWGEEDWGYLNKWPRLESIKTLNILNRY